MSNDKPPTTFMGHPIKWVEALPSRAALEAEAARIAAGVEDGELTASCPQPNCGGTITGEVLAGFVCDTCGTRFEAA